MDMKKKDAMQRVRFVQICSKESGLWAVDTSGNIWSYDAGTWARIVSPRIEAYLIPNDNNQYHSEAECPITTQP